MNIRKMTNEELEKLSHLDIAYNIIKSDKTTLSTVDLLKEICNVLQYGDKEFEALIGDFYTSLNLDKRFILIDGKWDLTENHAVKIVVDDDIDDDIDEYEEFDDEDEEEKEEEPLEDEVVVDDVEALEDVEDDIDDDIEDLSIVEEEELEEEEEDI